MEQQYRNHEADDQMELFEEEQQFPLLAVLGLLAVILLALTFSAMADARPKLLMLKSGLICHSQEQLIEAVDSLALADKTGTQAQPVEDCGWIVRPVMALMTPLATYENEWVKVTVAKMVINGRDVRYSYIAWEKLPPEV